MENFQIGRYKTITLTISFLFTSLLVLFGIFFAVFIYWTSSNLILDSSRKYFHQIEGDLFGELKSTTTTVNHTLNILGQTPVMSASTLPERLEYFPLFCAALQEHKYISGLQIGYPSGDYFIVRPIRDDMIRQQFKASEDSRFMVDNVTSIGQGRYMERIFFSHDLREISRDKPAISTYDPRERPWYRAALGQQEKVVTSPYFFHFIQQLGITSSYQPLPNSSIIGLDITLFHLSETIAKYDISPRSELVFGQEIANDFFVTAYNDPKRLLNSSTKSKTRPQIDAIESSVLTHLSSTTNFLLPFNEFEFSGETWISSAGVFDNNKAHDNQYLIIVSPKDEVLAESHKQLQQTISVTIVMLLLAIPVIWILAKRISTPLLKLATDTKRISRFEFTTAKTFKGSAIKEVHELGQSMNTMQWTLEQFTKLTGKLASEQDLDKLLTIISRETSKLGSADGVFTYLVNENENKLLPAFLKINEDPDMTLASLPSYQMDDKTPLLEILEQGTHASLSWQKLLPELALPHNYSQVNATVITFPLWTRNKEPIGTLCLLYKDKKAIQEMEKGGLIALLNTFSGFAAVALEGRKMLQMQKDLLEAFIKLIAGAIDSKSPYTGGHCQRVPELTKLIATKACQDTSAPFKDFDLDEKEWEALHIASWLHDCGKVTTPEYVVDKATKLETIYDRIHEVRMRFEVLKRDAEISYLTKMHNETSGEIQDKLQEEFLEKTKQLDADFEFIATCNIGGEFMAQEKIDRLHQIAEQTWQRTISDRVGIAWEERQRKERTPEPTLPALENVLADLPCHLIEHNKQDKASSNNEHNFILNTPKYLYNRGELYNLATERGTLAAEERHKINDHIVQTIIMLNKLPYPKHLKGVPDIAGCHHEKMDGTGYPRGLKAEQMTLPARMMAIADIYEALTASDRPYKGAKKLSQVVKIMSFMVKDKHIDPDLFRLLLSSGAYLEYAKKYLREDQIDEVDISEYLK